LLPDVSPDGRYVLFQTNRSPRLAVVGVAAVSDGHVLPFEILVEVYKPTRAILGRARWMPDGRAIAFTGQAEDGTGGVYVQPFDPARDTHVARRRLAGLDGNRIPESFAIDPAAKRLVLAEWDPRSAVIGVTGLP
jgi:Tol biopolymer transport system component